MPWLHERLGWPTTLRISNCTGVKCFRARISLRCIPFRDGKFHRGSTCFTGIERPECLLSRNGRRSIGSSGRSREIRSHHHARWEPERKLLHPERGHSVRQRRRAHPRERLPWALPKQYGVPQREGDDSHLRWCSALLTRYGISGNIFMCGKISPAVAENSKRREPRVRQTLK